MLAVPLAASDIKLNGTLSLAAVNNPEMCVVSGPTPEIAALEEKLAKQSVASRRLFTSHAFHSAMMDPILGEFEKRLQEHRVQASAHSLSLQCERNLDQSRGSHRSGLLGAPYSLDGSFLRQFG